MFSFILSLSSYASDACRNLRNNRSEISRNIGREVYSKLLEIVSTFLSRGFRSLKLRFLLSKEIFFINQCFRARQRKKKKKKMINSLPSFSRFPWHLVPPSFVITSRFLTFFFFLFFLRRFQDSLVVFLISTRYTSERKNKRELRKWKFERSTRKKGNDARPFFPVFSFFFFSP